MHTLHLDLLNEQSGLELEPSEAALILHMITYYNNNRNMRQNIPNYITSANKLSKILRIRRDSITKVLDEIAHNVADTLDISKDTNPKILFNYKASAQGIEIWKIKKL